MTHHLLGIGVDGAPRGWVAACCFGAAADAPPTERRSEPRFFASIASSRRGGRRSPAAMRHRSPLTSLSDCPRSAHRACDEVARGRLPGPRKGSVFHAPPRPPRPSMASHPAPGSSSRACRKLSLRASGPPTTSQPERSSKPRRCSGSASTVRPSSSRSRKLMRSSANRPRLGERDCRDSLFEVHPEMCFRAMNGGLVTPSKTSAHGQLHGWTLYAGNSPTPRRASERGPEEPHIVCSMCSTPTRRAGRYCAGRRLMPAPRSGAPKSRRLWRSWEDGRAPREEATGLLMRMMV
jgi:hypothetical protein